MRSTIRSAGTIEVTRAKNGKKVMKVACVVDYNEYMKAVDGANQHLPCYSSLLRIKKWTKNCRNRIARYLRLPDLCEKFNELDTVQSFLCT